jgi:hypothetical protein
MLWAGCIHMAEGPVPPYDPQPTVDWRPDACDPTSARSIAADVPWIPAWQGTPEEVASRVATALGHQLPPIEATRSTNEKTYWEAEELHFRYEVGVQVASGAWADELRVSMPQRWPGSDAASAERTLAAFFSAWSLPADLDVQVTGSFTGSAAITQYYEGRPLANTFSRATAGDGSGRTGWWSGLTLHPFHDLRDAVVTVTAADAEATAVVYDRCAMDREDRTAEAGYQFRASSPMGVQVRNASLVHQILVSYTEPGEPGHCGFGRLVNVDARTGAVHGSEWPECH